MSESDTTFTKPLGHLFTQIEPGDILEVMDADGRSFHFLVESATGDIAESDGFGFVRVTGGMIEEDRDAFMSAELANSRWQEGVNVRYDYNEYYRSNDNPVKAISGRILSSEEADRVFAPDETAQQSEAEIEKELFGDVKATSGEE